MRGPFRSRIAISQPEVPARSYPLPPGQRDVIMNTTVALAAWLETVTYPGSRPVPMKHAGGTSLVDTFEGSLGLEAPSQLFLRTLRMSLGHSHPVRWLSFCSLAVALPVRR